MNTPTHNLVSGIALALSLSLVVGCATPTQEGAALRYTLPDLPAVQGGCDPNAASKKWAVVVGVNFYRDKAIADLEGAVNDAWAFYHYMASPGGGAVPPTRLMLLLNEEATRAAIEGALGNFLSQACAQDQIIIYFAGHGVIEPNQTEEGFLLAHDSFLSNLVGTAVSMRRLPDFLEWRAGQAGELLMIIDACHSGKLSFPGQRAGVYESSAMVLKRIEETNELLEEVVTGRSGWGALSASAGDQFAQEKSDKGWATCVFGKVTYKGGLFTCHLLAGLAGRADEDQNGEVTLKELHEHMVKTVPRDSFQAQLPQLSGDIPQTTVVSTPDLGLPIQIPVVPERYRLEDTGSDLTPYVLGSATIAGVALLNGLVFQLIANSEADTLNNTSANNPGKNTRPEFEGFEEDQRRLRDTSFGSYIAGAGFAAVALALWSWTLLDSPEGIDEVYQKQPWFDLSPTPGGAGATFNWTWD